MCRSQWLPAEPGRPPPGDGDGSTLEAADAAEQENADPNAELAAPIAGTGSSSKPGHTLQPTGKHDPLFQYRRPTWPG